MSASPDRQMLVDMMPPEIAMALSTLRAQELRSEADRIHVGSTGRSARWWHRATGRRVSVRRPDRRGAELGQLVVPPG